MKNAITLSRRTPAEVEFLADYSMDAEAHVIDVLLTIIGWYKTAPWYLILFDTAWTRLVGPLLGALLRSNLPRGVEQWLWARRGLPTCSVDVQ